MKYIRIQVLVFVISIAKSQAMTVDELEDFSNFLKETSLLDQPLKKNPADEEDDAPISDHAWEESGRFEGDLILNERQRRLIVKDVTEGLSRNGLKDSTKRWPDNEVVVYIQREHFNSDQIQAILRGMEELSQASCVKFRPYKKGDRDAVVVQGSRRGCFSQVGYQGGYQVLNLSGRHPVGRGCFRHGTVVHEFLHTLGFYHMQSSPDRDDYINVVWENIVQPARHNFRKYNLFSVSDFGVGYDYDSVLHYSRKAFSSNGGDTLVPKQDGVQIGQRIGLSDKDTAKLNKMYCDADSSNLEAADDVPHTLVTKKKKTPKNQPFEGHGIGYHKGKTVVIKLPAAETKVRLPETPSNFVFDYFSKAPQAMSPTLIAGFGVGQKVTYSYKLPAGYQITEHKFPFYRPPAFLNGINNAAGPALVQHNVKENNVLIKPTSKVGVTSSNKTMNAIEDFDEKSVKVTTATNKDTVDSNDFTSVYKPNTDYSDFYAPVNKVRTKTDYYLNYSPNYKGKHAEKAKELPISNFKLTRQFIENLGESKPNNFHTDESKEREDFDHGVDTAEKTKSITKQETTARDTDPFSYVKIPTSKLEEIKGIHLINPEYTSKKYLINKHDFSSLYYPNENLSRDLDSKNALYKLFGESVPLPVDNYTSEENSNIHEEIQNSHINRDENNRTKQNVGFSSVYYPIDNLNKELASRNAPYILLGEPVPLPIYNYTSEDNSNINKYTEKIHINKEGADVNKNVDFESLYDPNDNRNGNPASRNAPYKLFSYPESLPVYDYTSKENSHIRDDTQSPDNIEEEEDDKIKEREREVGSPYYSNDNVNVNRDPASRNAPYKLLGDPVPLPVYRYTSEENSNIHDDDTQTANINREADSNVNKNVEFRSLYYPNNNINGVPAAKNPPYKLFVQPLPVFNYEENSQIDDDKLNTHTSREDGDNVNKNKSNKVTKKPTFNYRNDGDSDEDHYYKDFEHLGRSRTSDYIQPTSNEENVSKSYEVTEKNVEHVSLSTDKSNANNPKSQDGETNLEKYLPVILEKYQSYDDYDITTPRRFSKYDLHEFSKTQ